MYIIIISYAFLIIFFFQVLSSSFTRNIDFCILKVFFKKLIFLIFFCVLKSF